MSNSQVSGPAVPDHVPAELVWNHNLDKFNGELDDPYLAASRLHDGPPIIWAREAVFDQPGWVLTRKALIEEAFLSPELFSSVRADQGSSVGQALGVDWHLNPLEFDPPRHHQYRKHLNPWFTPKAVAAMGDSVKAVCDSLIAGFEHRKCCEFITEFAEEFPARIFLDMMGMSRDRLPEFLAWERGMLRGEDAAARVGAMRSVHEFLKEFIARQRRQPTTELMAGILSARLDGERPLNDGEIMGMCFLLYIGGLDTVYSSLGWAMRHLAGDSALQERLRNTPEDIPLAVDEFLRAYPVATPHRSVTRDLSFHGVPMRAGETVVLPTCLAGRDPEAYDDPHRVNIDRRSSHIAFAVGPHICLGRHLARRELATVIEAFLSRFRNIRIPEGEHYRFHTGGVFGVDYLPLEWDE